MKKQQAGFSLIELMFILVFLAIVLMYSVSATRNVARQDAIENTAIGIQNWLQSALAYYADHGKWPSDFNSSTEGLVGSYLPAQLVCTPFAGATPNGACETGNTSYTGSNNGKYYTVSAYVPDESIAKAIAGKLPSTEVEGLQVSSSVPVPGAQQGYITSAGIVTIGASNGSANARKIWLPPCEAGFEAHYLVTPQYYTTGFYPGSDNTKMSYLSLLGLSALKKTNGRYMVYGNTRYASSGFNAGETHRYGYYVTYCVPEGNWSSSGTDKISNSSGAADPQNYSSS